MNSSYPLHFPGKVWYSIKQKGNVTVESSVYKNWIAKLDPKTCLLCKKQHGKIFLADEIVDPKPPLHFRCRCIITRMKALYAGTATNKGNDGADWWLKWTEKLPNYYISAAEAFARGWNPQLGNLGVVAPQTMLFGGIYENKRGLLPFSQGRTWYEADINYESGFRGSDRIVWSNDGLVFVTYDHYKTFQEIV